MTIFEEYWQNIIKTGAEAGEPQVPVGTGPCELCDKPTCRYRTPEEIAERLACEDCGVERTDLEDCETCEGTGWITPEQKAAGIDDFTGHCDNCSGTGKELVGRPYLTKGRWRNLCDHHGFIDCEPCTAIQNFILDDDADIDAEMTELMRHHVRKHPHPVTGKYYDGKIDGKDQE